MIGWVMVNDGEERVEWTCGNDSIASREYFE